MSELLSNQPCDSVRESFPLLSAVSPMGTRPDNQRGPTIDLLLRNDAQIGIHELAKELLPTIRMAHWPSNSRSQRRLVKVRIVSELGGLSCESFLSERRRSSAVNASCSGAVLSLTLTDLVFFISPMLCLRGAVLERHHLAGGMRRVMPSNQ